MKFSFSSRTFDPVTGIARFSYEISGEHNYQFTEKVAFGLPFAHHESPEFSAALDALALVLGTSYWKLYCPNEIEVKFAKITKGQAEFFNALYTKGFGEFFYRNQIDFRKLISFPYDPKKIAKMKSDEIPVTSEKSEKKALVLVGGGKDSIVSYELVKKAGVPAAQFVVNNDRIKEAVMEISGAEKIIVRRELDPLLFKLAAGTDVYKGHVPATAIIQAIALCSAILYDFEYIVASNEESANYGNVSYLGEEINHQWSKSLECEALWAKYVSENVTPAIKPFSILRPLSEMKIIEMFSKHPEYFAAFSSCNKNFTIKDKQAVNWCCDCPKCAFVFAGLAAFLPRATVEKIFGENLFADAELSLLYRELLGIENIKPFECVGTPEEVKLMMLRASKGGEYAGTPIMTMFEAACEKEFAAIEKSEAKLLSVGPLETLPPAFRKSYEN